MNRFSILTIDAALDSLGEDCLIDVLSGFSCPRNPDIESFLVHKSIQFSMQGLAKTHLVFLNADSEFLLVGYFALASKMLFVSDATFVSKALKRRLNRFTTRIPGSDISILPLPLIAQLGKNFAFGYDSLITGGELLQMACDEVQAAQSIIGGKAVYLECEDTPRLVQFYESHGFQLFGKRPVSKHDCLLQLIRYF